MTWRRAARGTPFWAFLNEVDAHPYEAIYVSALREFIARDGCSTRGWRDPAERDPADPGDSVSIGVLAVRLCYR